MLGKLVLFLALVVPAGVVAAEVLIPPVVEERIEARVRERVPDAAAVDARLDSFPFVTRLLATGTVEELTVDLEGVERRGLLFALIRMRGEGIRLNRDSLAGGELEITAIERGTIVAEVTASAISDVVGVPVALDPGRATAFVAGREIAADVSVVAGELRVGAGPVSVSVPLPRDDLFPCDLSGEVLAGRARLRCTIHDVPPVLLDAATDTG